MTQATLEQRVSTLEKELAELRAVVTNGQGEKDWRSTIGMFAGDDVMREIFEEALKYREANRRQARRTRGADIRRKHHVAT
jgi:hypothetical protein